jgi:hypothetical protein
MVAATIATELEQKVWGIKLTRSQLYIKGTCTYLQPLKIISVLVFAVQGARYRYYHARRAHYIFENISPFNF